MPANGPKPDTIVLINGLWMTALSWEFWTERYTKKGYKVVARSWPGMEGDMEELRRNPPDELGKLGITQIADHYDAIVREQATPPIIMGHSFGGLMTQILVDRGLGAAGVAIDSAPAKGVLGLPFSTLKVSLPFTINPFNLNKVGALSEGQFQYAFGNLLSEEESKKVYERYAVPGPDHVLFQASVANFNPHSAAAVNFHNDDRPPLLLIAGGKDHIVPASTTKANFNLYKKSKAITDYKEFPERSHFTLGQAGWEEVADYALDWAVEHAGERASARVAG
jgi:alpha-beta hydrolase superfamily lysophospholipase